MRQNHNWQLEMYLARFLNKVFKKGGFILTDADSKDYIIGQPTDDPIKLKILNKKLHYKRPGNEHLDKNALEIRISTKNEHY